MITTRRANNNNKNKPDIRLPRKHFPLEMNFEWKKDIMPETLKAIEVMDH